MGAPIDQFFLGFVSGGAVIVAFLLAWKVSNLKSPLGRLPKNPIQRALKIGELLSQLPTSANLVCDKATFHFTVTTFGYNIQWHKWSTSEIKEVKVYLPVITDDEIERVLTKGGKAILNFLSRFIIKSDGEKIYIIVGGETYSANRADAGSLLTLVKKAKEVRELMYELVRIKASAKELVGALKLIEKMEASGKND